jgi:uncharacterized Fe-S cluster-containing radical SAM superfamily enzyme
MKKEKITVKKIPYLDYACNIGERVRWENIRREKFEGVLIRMDEECVATVRLDNGDEVRVQC